MILYFSGTGNSEYVARRLAHATGDEIRNLFPAIRSGKSAPLCSEKPWVLVVPTYAWRIPRVVESLLMRTELSGSRELYTVMTCGDGIGNAGKSLRALCERKGLRDRGVMEVVMPENYIALFQTPSREEALAIIDRAEGVIDRAAALINRGEAFPDRPVSLAGRVSSGVVNQAFYPLFVHARKFRVSDACISCGTCAAVCPLGNVLIANGKPVWGKSCTHCMACICRCPAKAIEYGRHSKGLPRYVCPKRA